MAVAALKERVVRKAIMDIRSLRGDEELAYVWIHTRTRIRECFAIAGRNFAQIALAFPSLRGVNFDTEMEYDSEQNVMRVDLLFTLCGLAIITASSLSSEFAMFKFLRRSGMLGKSKQEQNEFEAKVGPKLEILGMSEQRDFLKEYMMKTGKVDIEFELLNSQMGKVSLKDGITQIESSISNLRDHKEEASYKESGPHEVMRIHQDIARILHLSLPETFMSEEYVELPL